jgi:phage terminase large subunit
MQTRFLQSTAFETLAGGSRGPGKTDVGVVNFVKPKYLNEPRARGLVIRKNSDDLADWLDRARYYYQRYGGIVTGKPGTITFPSGYKIRCGHLKDENAYTKYQGQEFQIMLIEELTQIKREEDYLKLIASCRSSIPGLAPRVYATTNPGGKGHAWVKARFIDPSPPNVKFLAQDTGRTRIFLPGTVDDNPALMLNDPDYVRMLDGLKFTNEELWKAWRLGDWNTFAGQYFPEWTTLKHTVLSFQPKPTNVIVGGLDWGYSNPFSFHLAEVKKLSYKEQIFYRVKPFLECYGTQKTAREWSDTILKEMEKFHLTLDDVTWIQADPAIFNKSTDGSISIRDQFIKANDGWRKLRPASNDRIAGWMNMHQWLSDAPDGLPYYQVALNCENLIRTLPQLIHDELNVEDVDSDDEDHAPDEQRYMLKGLKWLGVSSGEISHLTQVKRKQTALINPQTGKQVSINLGTFGQQQIKQKSWWT